MSSTSYKTKEVVKQLIIKLLEDKTREETQLTQVKMSQSSIVAITHSPWLRITSQDLHLDLPVMAEESSNNLEHQVIKVMGMWTTTMVNSKSIITRINSTAQAIQTAITSEILLEYLQAEDMLLMASIRRPTQLQPISRM